MSGLESRDEGIPDGLLSDPDRYYGDAWERSKRLFQERSGSSPLATLVRGVAEMSLRGHTDEEVDRVVAALRAAGFGVWKADSSGTKAGNAAGYRYFTVQVPA